MNPYDILNISIDWSNLATALDDDFWRDDLVMTLPPAEDNEDFWTSEAGSKFSPTRKRRKNNYRYGLMVGAEGSGDTFQIVQMTGRKPPDRGK